MTDNTISREIMNEYVIPMALGFRPWSDSLKTDILGLVAKVLFAPKNIYYNEKNGIMVVIWKDGTKTKVKPMDGTGLSPYAAYTACLAKKVHGSNANVCRIVSEAKTPDGKEKVKKNDNSGRHETTGHKA